MDSSRAGVYNKALNIELSVKLGAKASVFQAEVFAISQCAELAMNAGLNHKIICSDSQAALKALNSFQRNSMYINCSLIAANSFDVNNDVLLLAQSTSIKNEIEYT